MDNKKFPDKYQNKTNRLPKEYDDISFDNLKE
jgi:hypothetical protein